MINILSEAGESGSRAVRMGVAFVVCIWPGIEARADASLDVSEPGMLIEIGRALFFDTKLSRNRAQSCTSCHDPARAFTDGRDSGVDGAVSLGDDGRSLGDRNAPTTAYTFLGPDFHRDENGRHVGGFFLDGRAETLARQAHEPFFNPIEMGLSDEAELAARVRNNPDYAQMFKERFGDAAFNDDRQLVEAVIQSISAFERTPFFAPFDSKYDRYLRGTYEMTALESTGRSLFFSPLTNCTTCHLSNTSSINPQETFTSYRYHNIGIPVNAAVRQKNGLGTDHRDPGLLANPAVESPDLAGKFKVPTLRNVAVTGPYMHNGIFKNLRTAILFYNKYTVSNENSQTNPETGRRWRRPEFGTSVDRDLLQEGQPIDDDRLEALIAFLKTLTDKRYETLLEN